jgi:hemerythrin
MPIIEWNAGFMVGIGELDAYHRQMVQLLNDSYDTFRGGGELAPDLAERLLVLAEGIFAVESKLMRDAAYPLWSEHQEEHDSYLRRIRDFRENQSKKGNTSIELLWFLCNWTTHHLRETDADLGRFLDLHKLQKKIRAKA